MKRTLSIARAKARFAECVRRAEAGETVILTRHGRPVARLAPVMARTGISAGEIREPGRPYGASSGSTPAPENRRDALQRLLVETIWPRVPEDQLGAAPDKREREEILGYGSEGT